VLKPELSATIGAERFLREIRVAAQLQHPNILGLYDSGVADGLLYYVMPFIEGESLRDRLTREHQLPIEDGVRIVREAAEALHYAHERKIIHRDIKPENILLQGGHALVADFGIAKAVEAAGQKLTETGMAVGTPHYMSPEQSLGGDMDGRSDEYSLGCVLYEVLVGQPPFDGPNAMAVLARHSLEQVPSMQVVRNSVPDAVEDAVFRALEKTPADRYPSMKEFAEALSEAEAEASLLRTSARRAAGGPRTPQQVPIGTRRTTAKIMRPGGTRQTPVQEQEQPVGEGRGKRTWLVAAAVTAVLAVAGIAGRQFLGGRGAAKPTAAAGVDDDARRVAVLYFQSSGDSLRYLADGLSEGLIAELAQVPELEVVSRNGVAPFRGSEIPRDSIARLLKVGTLVEGSVEQDKDRVRVTVRLIDAASNAEFQRASFVQPAGSYLSLGDSLAQKAALFLRERLGVELRLREQRSSTRSTDAWVLLQRAEQARKEAEDAAARGDSVTSSARFSSADSVAKLASEKDPAWNQPVLFRGRVAYRRSRLAVANPAQAKGFIDQGMGFAETVLGRDTGDPDALELRGTLEYWKWLLRLEQSPTAAAALFASARKDLETAVRNRPTQAGAWGSLSHLYGFADNTSETDIVLAARRAYESDAYLENAPKILERLFNGYYDLDQAVDAAHWCNEGFLRFPDNGIFTMCQLYVMTMRGQNPDPVKAWQLAGSEAIAKDPGGGSPELQKLDARLMVAAVLARAGLKDSARAVAKGGTAGTDIDPTRFLFLQKAFAQLLAGDKTGSIEALKVYLAANPDQIKSFAVDPGWRFRELSTDPAFQRLVGAP
jgi:serine/threonine-protein kinase